ncbi:MAG: putative membrane protein [Litorivivens sp.]
MKNKRVGLHKALMTAALVFSALFLLSYVAFHLTTPSTKFGGEGTIKIIYLTILLTHIVLSIVVVPLVLISYVRGLSQKFDKHRKIARITLPIWLYVTLTGVLVYLMISPYYSFNL